jgi:hypothetical protein
MNDEHMTDGGSSTVLRSASIGGTRRIRRLEITPDSFAHLRHRREASRHAVQFG